MNAICMGCPGMLTGDCGSCRVTRECQDRDDYEDECDCEQDDMRESEVAK